MIFILVTSIIVNGLLFYHIKIILRGLTTYQEIKKSYEKDFEFYFSKRKSRCQNLYSKFCIKTSKAFFEPSGYYQANYNYYQEDENKELNFKDEIVKTSENQNEPALGVDYQSHRRFYSSGLRSLNNSKMIYNRHANSTIPRTHYSRSKNISVDYKLPPGEIHLSDNEELENDIHLNAPRCNKLEIVDIDKESLNKRIISIINSSGTIDDVDSEGKSYKY